MTVTFEAVDKSDMLGAVSTLPAQLPDGYARSQKARDAVARSWPPASHGGTARPRTLVVCGMGGSGVGGDLLAAATEPCTPIVSVKGYDLPSWVTDEDRVVCLSYSGGTAETLSCFDQAVDRSVVAAVVTTGGELGKRAADQGIPVVELPTGMQPRAAVGVLFGGLLGIAEALNIVEHGERIIRDSVEGARAVVEQHAGDEDLAPGLQIARVMDGAIPVIYGLGSTAAVAWRWKAQINENGKLPAFANTLPELDHNEIVGWERAGSLGARWTLIELVADDVTPALQLRLDATRDLIADSLDSVHRFQAVSLTRAGAVFELVTLGDYVSVYLALLADIDPTPVERIQALKARLAGE